MAGTDSEAWADGHRTGEARALRARLCDTAALRPFLQRSPGKLLAALGFDYVSMVAAAALAVTISHPAAYLLAWLWIGGRQVGIGSVALHEGAHGLMLRDRARNDRLARVMLWSIFAPALTLTLDGYRRTHFAHHREVNGDQDPDRALTLLVCSSRRNGALFLLASLSGVLSLYQFWLYLVAGGWRRRTLAPVAVGGVVAAAGYSVLPAQLFLAYYVAPLVTWGMFVNQRRFMAEHYARGEFGRDAGLVDVLLTRDVLPSWFDRAFVTTRAVNYHLTHHLFPAVPFYNLAALQAHLATCHAYRASAHVTRGYHRFLAELFADRRPSPLRAHR